MADLWVPYNIGCEERERERKEKTSQHNKGWSSSRQQEAQESVLCQRKKLFFKITKLQAIQKKTFLLNQENHEKKQPR